MHRTMLLVVVAVCAITVVATASATEIAPAFGFATARYLALGGASIAVANDSSAVGTNPANLGQLDIGLDDGMTGMRPWSFEASGIFELCGDTDLWGVTFAGTPVNSDWGVGAAYGDTTWDDGWAVGFGKSVSPGNWSWGLSAVDAGNETIYNGGLLFDLPDGMDLKAGAVVRDLTDETDAGPYFDLGAKLRLQNTAMVALDIYDVTKELNTSFGAGIEYDLPNKPGWAVRGGVREYGLFSAGAGYSADAWRADLAWVEMDSGVDDEVIVSFSVGF